MNRSHAPDRRCFAAGLHVGLSTHSEDSSSDEEDGAVSREDTGDSRLLGSEAVGVLDVVGGSPVVLRGESVADLSASCGGVSVDRRNMVRGMGFGDGCLGLSEGVITGAEALGLGKWARVVAGLKTSSTVSSSLSLAQKQGPE